MIAVVYDMHPAFEGQIFNIGGDPEGTDAVDVAHPGLSERLGAGWVERFPDDIVMLVDLEDYLS